MITQAKPKKDFISNNNIIRDKPITSKWLCEESISWFKKGFMHCAKVIERIL